MVPGVAFGRLRTINLISNYSHNYFLRPLGGTPDEKISPPEEKQALKRVISKRIAYKSVIQVFSLNTRHLTQEAHFFLRYSR